MRAKLSTTADATYSGSTPPAHPASNFFGQDAGPDAKVGAQAREPRKPGTGLRRASRFAHAAPADLRGEGLLHDARNLVSAIGLYCDLLSMPGVLKPEHRQYPEELRLLGTRSRVLIEHLLRSLVSHNLSSQNNDSVITEHTGSEAYGIADRFPGASTNSRTSGQAACLRPVSLRSTVERSSGLLSRVANGHPIEVVCGPAADVPIWIDEEALERILVNLVRNAAQALDGDTSATPDGTAQHAGRRSTDLSGRVHRRTETTSALGISSAIRISVGPLLDRIGEARSWPFQHVRLVVEDSGCGMQPKQLHALLSGQMTSSQGTHGIGFRVVRELVAASNGDLRATSTPGAGTRVQIEWPVAATSTAEKDRGLMQRKREPGSTLKSPIEQHLSISQPSAATEARQGVN